MKPHTKQMIASVVVVGAIMALILTLAVQLAGRP